MPIHYVSGDLFTSSAQVLVNPVNCEGVMGRGLAVEFKCRWPSMFVVYQEACRTGACAIGRPWVCWSTFPIIVCFPTKDSWRSPSQLSYIDAGLERLVEYIPRFIHSLAFPKLGTGNGGLSWEEVQPVMERYLSGLRQEVFIYV